MDFRGSLSVFSGGPEFRGQFFVLFSGVAKLPGPAISGLCSRPGVVSIIGHTVPSNLPCCPTYQQLWQLSDTNAQDFLSNVVYVWNSD